MAKQEKKEYPTEYGSHDSMIVTAETERLGDASKVVCEDEHGMYITERRNVDTGLADPYRFAEASWREKHMKEKMGEVIDIIVKPELILD